MKNKKIIEEFNKLIKQIEFDIENTTNKKDKLVHMFRLKILSI